MSSFTPTRLFLWALIGTSFTILDEFHIWKGITVHHVNIIHDYFPRFASPNYALGGLLFYLFYAIIVGAPKIQNKGILGGYPCSPLRLGFAYFLFTFAYFLTAIMSGVGLENSYFPFICGFILFVSGIYVASYFAPNRKITPRLAFYLFLVMIVGVTFEWNLVSSGKGFTYGICPSTACLGTPVAISWLPFLYLHGALFAHIVHNDPFLIEKKTE